MRLALLLALHGAATAATLPDGRVLDLRCQGRGATAVVMEAGWGADGGAWNRVVGLLGPDVRTCVYGRAGAGGSTAADGRRGAAEIAADLRAGLRAAGVAPPYVLVGHSAGGVYVRAFRTAHPREVTGMVFVDSSTLTQGTWMGMPDDASAFMPVARRARECLDVALLERPLDDAAMPARCRVRGDMAAVWRARLAEIEALAAPTAAERAGDAEGFGDAPVVTLTAGRDQPPPARARWFAMHQAVAARSTRGDARLVEDSGHLMMRDRPDAVAQAVRDVLAWPRR